MAKLFECQHEETHRLSSGLMKYQADRTAIVQAFTQAGRVAAACMQIRQCQSPPGSQLLLGRELLLTYSLCRVCKAGSGMWKACSAFQTSALDSSATSPIYKCCLAISYLKKKQNQNQTNKHKPMPASEPLVETEVCSCSRHGQVDQLPVLENVCSRA